MSFATRNAFLPTNARDERGATSSPAVARAPPANGQNVTQTVNHNTARPWGATPEKMAILASESLPHMYSDAFASIFEAHAPISLDGARVNKRLAFIAATGYSKQLPGAVTDLVFWGSMLPTRRYICDYLWDGHEDPSSHSTRANILSYLRRLTECASPGDEIVLIFSGHGDKSAYLPMGCPPSEAIYPADLRASFINLLLPGVAVLVVWDTCNASNPLELPQRLDLRDDCLIFEPTEFSLDDNDRSVILISASSGTTVESVLGVEPVKVQCGPLCWAFFSFIFSHLKDDVEPEGILKVFIKYIRSCLQGQEGVNSQAHEVNTVPDRADESKVTMHPQFLSSNSGPDVPPEVVRLLDFLLTAYHLHAVPHSTTETGHA